jgi:tetratricopeptide (TPR) repeat protein
MGKAQRRKRDSVPTRARAVAPPRQPAGVRVVAPPSLLPAVVLVAAGLAVYANSFSVPFLFDDHFEILRNPEVKAIESPLSYLTRARGIPTLLLALNYRWGGQEVWGYHLVNLAIHLAGGLVVFALTLATLRLPVFGSRFAGRERVLALLTALAFVAHPLQTMAVSYIVQRAESIAAFFYLLGLYLFVRGETAAGWSRPAFYAATVGAAFLGVMSKQTVVTLPATALAYRLCFLAGRSKASLGRRALGWLVLLAPAAYALYLSRAYLLSLDAGAAEGGPRAWLFIPTAGFELEGVTPLQYLLTQFEVVLWYLRLYVLPTAQCFDYGWPLVESAWRLDVLLPLAVLLLLFAVAVVVRHRHPLFTFAVAWFVLTLLPSSSFVPLRDAAFEHRMYLPVFGLALLTVAGGCDLAAWIAARAGVATASALRAAGAVFLLWLLLLGGLTVRRNALYGDPLRLARDSAEKAPWNWRAHYEVAFELLQKNQPDDALPFLQKAVELAPERGAPRVQLGEVYARRGRYEEAIEVLRPATHEEEESVVAAAHRNLGFVYVAKNDPTNAIAELEAAAQIKPDWVSVREQLAQLYTDLGLWYGAAAHFNAFLRLRPRQPASVKTRAAEVNYRAGVVFLHSGKPNAAVRLLLHALDHRPNFPDARHYLAISYAADGKWEQAQAEIARLAAQRPGEPLIAENARLIAERLPPIDPGAPFGPPPS